MENSEAWQRWLPVAQSIIQLETQDLDEFLPRFERYYAELMALNAQVNLTRIPDFETFLYRHLLDSLTILPMLPPQSGRAFKVVDIGCGGGFPLIPLAIARPDIAWTGIESTGKKVSCLQLITEALELSITLFQGRAEELAKQAPHAHAYDVVTARAVAPLDKLLPWTVGLLKPGGRLWAMKGQKAETELATVKKLMTRYRVKLLNQYQWPDHPALAGASVLEFIKS